MIRLRPPTEDDVDAMFRIYADPRTNEHNPDGPDADLEVSRARLAGFVSHWAEHGFGYWVVEADDGTVVGFCGVRHATWQGRAVLNLGYRFAPEAWGRGIASSVAASAVRWAREHQPDRPVLAYTTEDNVASQRTALRAGLVRRPDLEFELDGLWAVVFSEPENGSPSALRTA